MKILLSAYACEPKKGSEPGVGWHWALALRRRGYNVHVITRSNNRSSIESAYGGADPFLTFHYFDLPTLFRFWKHWPGGIYLYYLLWQIGVLRIAKRLHAIESFDCVQHITFVSFRQPSFLGELGIPFIFGPVGGGEAMPIEFRRSLPLRARIAEAFRSAGNRFATIDPLMHRTYSLAQMIVCTTEETMAAIPAAFRNKCIVQRAIGIDRPQETRMETGAPTPAVFSKPQFLFVGRLLYWKGLHLALRALALVRREDPNITFRIIGEGSERRWLQRVARQSKVTDCVEWIPRKPHNEIEREYRESTALIFPSLHDSGGMVVLEAMSAGLPVVCLGLGGPGSIVTAQSGFAIPASKLSEDEAVRQIASAMIRLATDEALRTSLAEGACRRAAELTWDAAVEGVYGPGSPAEQLRTESSREGQGAEACKVSM
jgi:glycosyltransferase involved in cell wall biosynthesis